MMDSKHGVSLNLPAKNIIDFAFFALNSIWRYMHLVNRNISFSSVIKHHNKANNRRKHLIGVYRLGGIRVQHHHGRVGMSLT